MALKKMAPAAPLAVLLPAATLPDLLYSILLLTGAEHARIVPGITAAIPLDLYDYPWSHSLLMNAIAGSGVAGAWLAWKQSGAGAWAVFFGVVSDWVLDFVSHRPDMPLAPGLDVYPGLGLWRSIPATYAVEGALWAAGLAICVRLGGPCTPARKVGFRLAAAALTGAWIVSVGAPPPPDLFTMGLVNLSLFPILFGWALWADRQRG
jgi:hypothetical protein